MAALLSASLRSAPSSASLLLRYGARRALSSSPLLSAVLPLSSAAVSQRLTAAPASTLIAFRTMSSKKSGKGKAKGSSGKGGKAPILTFDPTDVPMDLEKIDAGMAETVEQLRMTFNQLRTGEATPALLSDVVFQRDGTQRKLEHAGIISVRNKNTLMVNMYDEGDIAPSIQAIMDAGIAPNPVREAMTIKVVVPKITREYRQELAKVAKDDMEHAKTRIRGARNKAVAAIKKHSDDLSIDLVRDVENYIQGLQDKHMAALDVVYEEKSNEILNG